MTSSAMAFLAAVLICLHVKLSNCQPSIQMLTSSSPGLQKDKVSFASKRDEEISPSPDYISTLWSDIEDALRFLDEQPVERSPRQKSSLDNPDRMRKQEKINKLPFTQHNFIRFGKRFHPNLDTPSTSSLISEDATSEDLKLQGILNRLKDTSYVKPDMDSPELAYVRGATEQNEGGDLDRFEKRHLHKFVRFGKRYYEDTNPTQVGIFPHGVPDSENGVSGNGKRVVFQVCADWLNQFSCLSEGEMLGGLKRNNLRKPTAVYK